MNEEPHESQEARIARENHDQAAFPAGISPKAVSHPMTPLFIPLKTIYFEQFANGTKTTEYRPYGPRWNERTCWNGRPVTLSKGYGKYARLSGVVERTAIEPNVTKIPGWADCYGKGRANAFCITIKLNPPTQ